MDYRSRGPSRLCILLLSALAAMAVAIPTLSVKPTVNLGTPIVVSYDISDGLDGRSATDPRDPKANDWIGLFPAGACTNPVNNQDKHKCYVHWFYVPSHKTTGSVTFEAEHYKTSGDFEARYFYGDDPTIPGSYEWVGQGVVCNSYVDSNSYASNSYATADGVRETFNMLTGLEETPGLTSVWQTATTDEGNYGNKIRISEDVYTEQTYWVNDLTGEVTYSQPSPMKLLGLTLAQCQCDSEAATQTIDGVETNQETCLKYRAACSRCILDSATTSGTVTVTGSGGTDTYQDMSSIPGFEISF